MSYAPYTILYNGKYFGIRKRYYIVLNLQKCSENKQICFLFILCFQRVNKTKKIHSVAALVHFNNMFWQISDRFFSFMLKRKRRDCKYFKKIIRIFYLPSILEYQWKFDFPIFFRIFQYLKIYFGFFLDCKIYLIFLFTFYLFINVFLQPKYLFPMYTTYSRTNL